MKIAVLGAGMVGRAIAIDLSKKHDVTSFDISDKSLDILEKNCIATKGCNYIKTITVELSKYKHYPEMLKDFDFVVTAVPGFMGYDTLQAVIMAKKNVVDISFFPEDALQLNKLAKENGVTAIVDCGVAPGMSNLILGYLNSKMRISSFECLVGGLPKARVKPFEYKAPFSPIDVLEEYTRPARYVENGCVVTKPAMSDTELINFEEVGTLESFNTDVLRSILTTMSHIPNMKEKTLRYPGHISLMKSLFDAGFLDATPVNISGQEISPMRFTSAVLFDKWKLGPNEEEFTIMDIKVTSTKGYSGSEKTGMYPVESKTINYRLFSEYDKPSQTSSMARTTGYTACAALDMLIHKLWTKTGVFPPELIGQDESCFNHIIEYLKERGINYKIS